MKRAILIVCALAVMLSQAAIAQQKGMNEMWNAQTIAYSRPFSYDINLAGELELADEAGFFDEYFRLQAFYTQALFAYLDQCAGLSDLDRVLAEHELRLMPAEEPGIYQRCGSNGMKYLFLRSNVCIERLDRAELDALRDLQQNQSAEEAVQFVQNTFARVLKADPAEPDDMIIVYEPDGRRAQNNAIVLGLATDAEYDDEGNFVSGEHEEIKDEFLKVTAIAAGEKISEALGHPVEVLLY